MDMAEFNAELESAGKITDTTEYSKGPTHGEKLVTAWFNCKQRYKHE